MPIPTAQEARGRGRFHGSWCLPVHVMTDITTADLVTTFTPGFAGSIVKWYWVQGTVAAGTAAVASLNLEINTVDVISVPGTNSTIALTLAACTPVGKVIEGSSIGGSNAFDRDDTISVEAALTTAFTAGAGTIVIEYEGKIQ